MIFHLAMIINQSQYINIGRSIVRIAIYLTTGIFLTMDIESNSTAHQILAMIQSEGELGLTRTPSFTGQTVFALWLCSSKLEVQLRPNHKPIELAAKWNRLIKKYSSQREQTDEEPLLCLKRNVFLSRSDEEQIKETKVLELLYAEARNNVLQGNKLFTYFIFLYMFYINVLYNLFVF